jgi:preprotein translocase subunit YajC
MGTEHVHVVASAVAAAATKSGSSSYTLLIFIVAIFGVMYFVMIRPQRNRQREAQATQRQVGTGSRVRTTAGMYGTIVDGDDNNVLVEFAPGVQIKMMRRAIMGVVPDSEPDGLMPHTADEPEAEADTQAKTDRQDLSI